MRVSQAVAGAITNYVSDVNGSLPVLLSDGTHKYVWGVGLAYAVDNAGNLSVYHSDGLGSVRAVTDTSGSVVQTYRTDEFGVPTQRQGTSSQPFGYTGEPVDANGLVYLRARSYDPTLGRFLSRDPLAGSMQNPLSQNRYSYALNRPCSWTDPSGLSPAESACALPEIPTPHAENILSNIQDAQRHYHNPGVWAEAEGNPVLAASVAPDLIWFINMVRPGGRWDLKDYYNNLEYEDFGNFHFGIVAAAMGLPLKMSLEGGGVAQLVGAITDKLGGHRARPTGWPWGDDPKDSMWITIGWKWYQRCH